MTTTATAPAGRFRLSAPARSRVWRSFRNRWLATGLPDDLAMMRREFSQIERAYYRQNDAREDLRQALAAHDQAEAAARRKRRQRAEVADRARRNRLAADRALTARLDQAAHLAARRELDQRRRPVWRGGHAWTPRRSRR